MKNAGQHNGEHLLENKAQEETGQVKRMTQRYHQFRVSINNPLSGNPQLILDHTFQFNTIEGTILLWTQIPNMWRRVISRRLQNNTIKVYLRSVIKICKNPTNKTFVSKRGNKWQSFWPGRAKLVFKNNAQNNYGTLLCEVPQCKVSTFRPFL